MKEKISDVLAFFRNPRCRTMVRYLHAHKSLSGNDLCQAMGITYDETHGGKLDAVIAFHVVRAHVSSCLWYFGAQISSDGKRLENNYWLENLK